MWWCLAVAASGAAPSEEVVVYGDPWARWRDTRWMVESDVLVPVGVAFTAERNLGFTSYLFQVRAVLACDLEGEAGKRRAEVGCRIEDLALLPTTLRDFGTPERRDRVARVVQEVDTTLTGTTVQLQVDAAGGVTDFDLEGLDPANARERESVETLREVVARVVSGFHLRVPDAYRAGGEWPEYHSALMDLPSLVGSRGSSTLVHRLSTIDGHPVLQTIGEGSAAITVPTTVRDLIRETPEALKLRNAAQPSKIDGPSAGGGLGGGAVGGGPSIPGLIGFAEPPLHPPSPELAANQTGPGSTRSGNVLLLELTYTLTATGVGVFQDGVLSERVWVVNGLTTPSSPPGPPYVNRGRIRRLGPEDHPDLGVSHQVAYPGYDMEGLPPWENLP